MSQSCDGPPLGHEASAAEPLGDQGQRLGNESLASSETLQVVSSENPTPPAMPPTDESHPSDMGFWAAWAVLSLGAWYLGQYLWDVWSTQGDYNHGFLIPPMAAWFAYETWPDFLARRRRPSGVGLLLVGLGAFLFTAFSWMALQTGVRPVPLYGMGLGLLLAMTGLLAVQHGLERLRVWAFPLFLLLLALPIPSAVRDPVQLQLKTLATHLSGWVLTVLIPGIQIEGHILRLPSGDLGVEDACSGIRSLMALTTFAVLMGYLRGGTVASGVALLIASVPIAVLANLARIVATALIQEYVGQQYTQDIPGEPPYHTLLGLLVFVVGIGLLMATSAVLPDEAADGPGAPHASPDRAERPGPSEMLASQAVMVSDAPPLPQAPSAGEVVSLKPHDGAAITAVTGVADSPAAAVPLTADKPAGNDTTGDDTDDDRSDNLSQTVLPAWMTPVAWMTAVTLAVTAATGAWLDSLGPTAVYDVELDALPEILPGGWVAEDRDASPLNKGATPPRRLMAAALTHPDALANHRGWLARMARDHKSLESTSEILQQTRLVHRLYQDRLGRSVDVWAIFWSSARCATAGPHSPDVCLPLNSFELKSRSTTRLTIPGAAEPVVFQSRLYRHPATGQEQRMLFNYQSGAQVNRDINWDHHPNFQISYREFVDRTVSGRWTPVDCTAQLFVMVSSLDFANTPDGQRELESFTATLMAEVYRLCPWAAPPAFVAPAKPGGATQESKTREVARQVTR